MGLTDAQASLRDELAAATPSFPAEFLARVADVNSYGHTMARLDALSAEILYYVGEVLDARTAFQLEEACKYFDSIFEDFYTAAEAAGFDVESLEELEA